jgi:hypothetical protein
MSFVANPFVVILDANVLYPEGFSMQSVAFQLPPSDGGLR